MSKPNKSVAAARRRMGGFPPRPARPHSEFMVWFFEQVQKHDRKFDSMEQAEAAFAAESQQSGGAA